MLIETSTTVKDASALLEVEKYLQVLITLMPCGGLSQLLG